VQEGLQTKREAWQIGMWCMEMAVLARGHVSAQATMEVGAPWPWSLRGGGAGPFRCFCAAEERRCLTGAQGGANDLAPEVLQWCHVGFAVLRLAWRVMASGL
jgi:hypothetical protein